ncbi:hypothetical protein BRV05_000298 [Escherichia coli]|nr:hypothetical protein [Escherichia coli]
METLITISRWLAKQHVVTWCVQQEGELWCANAFYLFDAQKVAFYILTEEKTRHAQMSGPQAAVARMLSAPVWEIRLDEIKFTDNTLGFGKKMIWLRGSGTEQA